MRFVLSCSFVLLFAALALAGRERRYHPGHQEGCPLSCFLNFDPVCGRNPRGKYRTFHNKCLFNDYNCKNPESKYEYVAQGNCEDLGHEECPDFCLEIYSPVCGVKNDGQLRTFSNQCEMKSFNCETSGSKYEYVKEGDCFPQEVEDCPKYCTLEVRPVCAKGKAGDLRTFSSECDVESYNCDNPQSKYKTISSGGCVRPETVDCPKSCPESYHPVCGRNAVGHHRTFSSDCLLSVYNCNNPDSTYSVVYEGRC